MKPERKGALGEHPRRIATMVVSLLLFVFAGSPAYAQNPQKTAATDTVAYLDCLLSQPLRSEEDAARSLVNDCGYKTTQPIDEFVKDSLSNLPTDPLASVASQAEPYRHLYTREQFAYFEQMDDIIQNAKSYDDALSRMVKLEQQAAAKLGRSEQDLKVLDTLSTSRSVFEYIMNHPADVQARGFWRTLVKALAVFGAVAGGFIAGGPVGGMLAGWAVLGAFSKSAMDRFAETETPIDMIERRGLAC
ncbi:hypothetical protein J5226_08375 [Lysobacter sp. K5869]|uniref:hypothetical protein n=1 Tax=Lysobacter sp. K5869 TaxID=2820808 RepID=UPI001C062CB9|nr:hypothetical protein [Lysobacter sp. K5869]QWP78392.1 hypothetical protein J5226_08375 [Lysobacter sp. K5869]